MEVKRRARATGLLVNFWACMEVRMLSESETMIAGVAAVQEKSDSQVATLGYSYTAAFGHIFLTTWGTIIISLMT